MYSQLTFDYVRFFRTQTQTVEQTLRSVLPKPSFRGVSTCRIFPPLIFLWISLLLIWAYTQPLKMIKIKIPKQIQNSVQALCSCKEVDNPGKIIQDQDAWGAQLFLPLETLQLWRSAKGYQTLFFGFATSTQSWDSGTLMLL